MRILILDSIQYPSDWQDLGDAINYENTSSKSIRLPEKYPLGAFMVEIAPIERYLDPDTLTLKTISTIWININKMAHGKGNGPQSIDTQGKFFPDMLF